VRAVALFDRAAAPDLQDSSALFFLGALMLRPGEHGAGGTGGVRPNARRALRLLELAAGQGHGGAALFLAQFWREGDAGAGLPASAARARHFLETAADELGEPDALFELGDALARGRDGLAPDLPRALSAYERAASQGHVAAAVSAGAMYFHGLGAPQSYALALARYRAAAELGSLEAWRNVASMHALGQGVAQSRETARAMMRMVERIEREQQRQQEGGAAPAPAEQASSGAAGGGAASGGGGGCGKCGKTGTDGCG
jgi:hypothetical protein